MSPIHTFSFQQPGPANLKNLTPVPKLKSESIVIPDIRTLITPFPVAKGATGEIPAGKQDDIFFGEEGNLNIAEDVKEILPAGFITMDRGVKNYFSGIRIPTTDGMRMMNVRMAGGDKTLLVWSQDLKGARVTLPVLSINRESAEFNSEKFSPPYVPISQKFTDREGSRIVQGYRPVPYLIDYTLTIWAEHKADAEYATYQINTRFNPLAEFVVEDEHIRGNVIMKFNGWTDSSDKDVDANTRANTRYDISISVEGWLPLPTKVVPSILGRVTTLKDTDTNEVYGRLQPVIQVR